jgi:ferric-dicitrate binding protein FerR (iron transport regulator)
VQVLTGKVSVKSHEREDSALILTKGEMVEMVNGKLMKGPTDINAFSWKSKNISFESEDLSYVADIISDVYDVNISLATGISNNCAFTANFNNAEIEEVLQVLAKSCGVEIQQTKGNYYTIE